MSAMRLEFHSTYKYCVMSRQESIKQTKQKMDQTEGKKDERKKRKHEKQNKVRFKHING